MTGARPSSGVADLESVERRRNPGSRDTRELEYQFSTVSLAKVEQWLREHHADFGFELEPAGTRSLDDTYLDTADWRIFRAGYKLRLRQTSGCAELTFKSLRSSQAGPLKDRREVSHVVRGADLESMRTARGLVADWLRSLAGKPKPSRLFRLSTQRTAYFLKRGGERIAEVDLDECRVEPGQAGAREPLKLHFVELEGQATRQRDVQRFMRAMAHECDLQPSPESKFGAGLSLSGLTPVGLPPAEEAAAFANADLGTFALGILRQEWAEVRRREAGTRLGEEPEELHQMRVALRRLRAALRLFRDALPRSLVRCQEPLRWLASSLGGVRDLDVKLAEVRGWRDESDEADRREFNSLLRWVANRRSQERRRMIRALDSRRYVSLIQRLEHGLNRSPLRNHLAQTPAMEALPDLIRPLHKAVLKAGRHLGGQPEPEDYHRLRVRAKRLRYSLDFAANLSGRAFRGPRKRLAALQDLLGGFNDTVVARANIRGWIEEPEVSLPPRALFLLGMLEERLRARGAACQEAFPKRFREFSERPWSTLEKVLREESPPR